MDEKYIDLLLDKCVDFSSSKILFIYYNTEISDFVKKIVKRAHDLGIEEIYLDEVNSKELHDILQNHTVNELNDNNYFDKSIWDEYAKKKASFLIIETEHPHLMDDIESEKIAIMTKQRRESRPIYRKMVERCELPWCVVAYPGESWAKEIFPDDEDSYKCLEEAISKICMLDSDDPIASWDKQLEKIDGIMERLNNLSLKKIHYKNGLGTDLVVYLPDGYLFESAKDNDVIVNMPSYEVFTSPIYDKTEGIVYSSMPLNYGGATIDEFWIKFEQGKVVDYDAKVGKDVLKEIVEADDNSCYLGECALVEKNSPISNLELVFGTTLIDENASCHLALGSGFPECLRDGISMEDEELLDKGVNVSKTHVDFMIGTDDLEIVGTTNDGKEISIFVNGNFSKDIIGDCKGN